MKALKMVAVLLLAAGCNAHGGSFGGSGGSSGSGGSGGFGGSGGSGGGQGAEASTARAACVENQTRSGKRVDRVRDVDLVYSNGQVVGADVVMDVRRGGERYRVLCHHVASTGAVRTERI